MERAKRNIQKKQLVAKFSAICKVVAQPVGKHLLPVNAVRRLRRHSRRNSTTSAQRRSSGQLFRAAAQTLLRRGPASKKSRRKQTGEDDSQLIRYLRRLFRNTGRHVGDEWQDDPTDGTDWYSRHRQQQRIAANSNNSPAPRPPGSAFPDSETAC